MALLSGVGGLGSEVILLRALDYSVGSGAVVAPVVVATFIVGLGLGSLLSTRVERPWGVELFLAALAILWVVGFGALSGASASAVVLLAPAIGIPAAASIVGGALALVPATALGVSLPVIAELSGSVGRVYAWHTLGALVAIVVIEAGIYPTLGMPGAFGLLAAAHFALAVMLWRARRRADRVLRGGLAGHLVVAGVGTGVFQSVWLLLAALLLRPFFFVTPGVVGAFLLGNAVGAALWYRVRFTFASALTASALGMATSAVLAALSTGRAQPTSAFGAVAELVMLLLPAVVPIGSLFPAYVAERFASRTETGGALMSLAAGNAVGLVGGAVLTSIAPVGWALATGALVLTALCIRKSRALGLGAAAAAVAGAFGASEARIVKRSEVRPDLEIQKVFRGPGELAAIYSHPGRAGRVRRLYQTGYSPVSLDDHGMTMESMIGAFGVAYAPRLGRALVLGAGSGRTAGIVATAFEQTDVVDVGATVPQLLEDLASVNYNLPGNERATLHVMDGVLAPRRFAGARFDLVVHTVHPSYVDRAAKLYTVEYLDALKGTLAETGVLVAWSDRSIGPRANAVLLKTFSDAFEHRELLSVHPEGRPSYFGIIVSDAPLSFRRQQLARSQVGDDPASKALLATPLAARRVKPPPAAPRAHRFDRPSIDILIGGYRWYEAWR